MRYISNLKVILEMSWRNIFRQKKRAALIMSAAAVGMVGILLSLGFMNGMRDMMVKSGIESGVGHVQVRPLGYNKKRNNGMVLKNASSVEVQLLKISKSKKEGAGQNTFRYAARLEKEGLLRLDNNVQGVNISGIDYLQEPRVSQFDEWIKYGKYLSPASSEDKVFGIIPCLIGYENAKKFEVEVSDTIILSLLDINSNSVSIRARIQGIFQSVAEPIDKFTVLVHRSDLALLYANQTSTTGYFVLIGDSLDNAKKLKKEIQQSLPEKDIEVLSYQDLEPGITRMFELSDSTMYIFYLILLFGYALILLNSVLMSVFERMREFGILRALGTPLTFIFQLILFEATFLATLGCASGIISGGLLIAVLAKTGISLASFSKGMELMAKSGTVLYPYLIVKDVLTSFSMGVLISICAAIYPAFKAIRLTPIKAIYNR